MYVGVPPVHEAVKVIVLPDPRLAGNTGDEIRIGTDKAGFTVTSLFIEFVVWTLVWTIPK